MIKELELLLNELEQELEEKLEELLENELEQELEEKLEELLENELEQELLEEIVRTTAGQLYDNITIGIFISISCSLFLLISPNQNRQ
jgi:ATP-dependent helicase/DNAse subunit B